MADRAFLEKVFHKLLLNFTWWVNRKDPDGANIFQGGFLGLDNIGVFDRSAPLPTGGHLEQSDGTSWMGMYCLNMLAIALELAKEDMAYEDVASKFFEHFVYIAHAMNDIGNDGMALWDNDDGFYYDVLRLPDGSQHFLKIRSMVGLIPLFAVETLEPRLLDRFSGFRRRMNWFMTRGKRTSIPQNAQPIRGLTTVFFFFIKPSTTDVARSCGEIVRLMAATPSGAPPPSTCSRNRVSTIPGMTDIT